MKKHNTGGLKLKNRNGSLYTHFVMGIFVFFIAFIISGLVSSSLFPVSDSSAQEVSVENRATGYFVSVTAPSSVSIPSVTPTPEGVTSVSPASTVNVVTNAPLGYKLYLSATNVDLTATDITSKFAPTSSTTLSTNSWGYSLDSASTKSWSAVSTTQENIASQSSSNYPDGTNTSVYFGINANTNMAAATYSTTVTYTAIAEGVPEEHTMQEFTVVECKAMTEDQQFYLMDSRDNKIYSVTKMKDGHCWMTENLKLGSTSGTMTLTPDDSNISTNITLPQVLSSGDSNRTSMQVWANTGSYDGYYYNWCAAVAYGAVDGGTGNCDGVTTEQTNSVCPKGWRLPGNSGDYSFSNLFGQYGLPTSNTSGDYVSTVEASPLSFTRAGYYNSGYSSQGSYGYYWSRVPNSSTFAYYFLYGSSSFYPQDYNYKNLGFSVRCVLDDSTLEDATYMQDVTLEMCNRTAVGTSVELLDKRGYGDAGSDTTTTYGVLKAKDGNCWMADNLRLYNKAITATDSDVTSNFTIPASSTWNTNNYTSALMHVADGTGQYADKNNTYGTYGEAYYNWCAATAQTSCGGTSVATTSICPKNWKLPLNGDKNTNYSYAKLLDSYSLTTGAAIIAKTELGFAKYYGYWHWYSASESNQGSRSNFWSATPSSAANAYNMRYYSSSASPQNNDYKGYGFSVRCVVRN